MAQYPLGIIIRQRRDMLGLSQQQLCQGICDRSTLSRIERGDQVPAYSTLRALLQRLGLQEKDIRFFLSQPDFETAQLQKEIVALNTRKQWLQAQQKIRQLQALPTAADPLTRQFILRAKALAGYEQDGKAVPYSYEEQRQMLLEALQISCPGIDPEHLQGHLLGEEEGKLLNQIAITYSESGERRRAIEIYRQLMDYIQTHQVGTETGAVLLPLVTYNYSCLLGRERRYEECIEVAEIGRQCCIMYNKCKMLGGLIFNIACCCHDLGQDEKCKELLVQSYYVHKAMERNSSCEVVKNYAKEKLDFLIDSTPQNE